MMAKADYFVRLMDLGGSDAKERLFIPPLLPMLLYFEWLSTEKVSHLAKIVSEFSLLNSSRHDAREILFQPITNLRADGRYAALLDQLIELVGANVFHMVGAMIADGKLAVPLGLCPTPPFKSKTWKCPTCSTRYRFFRCFCYSCGSLLSIQRDLCQMLAQQVGQNLMTRALSDINSTRTRSMRSIRAVPSKRQKTQQSSSLSDACMYGGNLLLPGSFLANSDDNFYGSQCESEHASTVSNIGGYDAQETCCLTNASTVSNIGDSVAPYISGAPPQGNVILLKYQSAVRPLSKAQLAALDRKIRTETHANREIASATVDKKLQVKVKAIPAASVRTHQTSLDNTDKYGLAALRGLLRLYLCLRNKDLFARQGGDMLLLMRNIAVNCSGLHSRIAKRAFQKMCKRWVRRHESYGRIGGTAVGSGGGSCCSNYRRSWKRGAECAMMAGESDNDSLHWDVLEGALVISQVLRKGTRSREMYVEITDEAYMAESVAIESALALNDVEQMLDTVTGRIDIDDQKYIKKISFKAKFAAKHKSTFALSSNPLGPGFAAPGLQPASNRSLHSGNASAVPHRAGEDTHELVTTEEPMSTVHDEVDQRHNGSGSGSGFGLDTYVDVDVDYDDDGVVACFSSDESGDEELARVIYENENRGRNTRLRGAKLKDLELLSENFDLSLLDFDDVSTPEQADELMRFAVTHNCCMTAIKKKLSQEDLSEWLGGMTPSCRCVLFLHQADCPNCGTANTRDRVGRVGGFQNASGVTDSSSSSSAGANQDQTHATRAILCSSCSLELPMKEREFIAYYAATSLLCYGFIAREVGFDLDQNAAARKELAIKELQSGLDRRKSRALEKVEDAELCTLSNIVYMLPQLRSYRKWSPTERNFFEHQCYFVTHLIYVFSDYGQYPLKRQLFGEEFEFIVKNMEVVIFEMDDPEIVGEFLQCLRILQYSRETDPELEPVFTVAMDYLLRKEVGGRTGRWEPPEARRKRTQKQREGRDQAYDEYHACYCAIVGLLAASFSQEEAVDQVEPPRPRLLHHLLPSLEDLQAGQFECHRSDNDGDNYHAPHCHVSKLDESHSSSLQANPAAISNISGSMRGGGRSSSSSRGNNVGNCTSTTGSSSSRGNNVGSCTSTTGSGSSRGNNIGSCTSTTDKAEAYTYSSVVFNQQR